MAVVMSPSIDSGVDNGNNGDVQVAGDHVESPSGAGSGLSVKDLERRLMTHAGHIAAAEARWLGWLGEYCACEGWGDWGCTGPVQWLSWNCGMSKSTAREKVRVANALRELPVIRSRFAEGRLSYSKVRAITRVAAPEDDADLAALAVAATGAQLDTIVRSFRKALDALDGSKASAWHRRSWRGRDDEDDASVFTLRVERHHAQVVHTAIANEVNRQIDDLMKLHPDRCRKEVIDSRGGWSAMAADAAVAFLNGTARTDAPEPTSVEIIVDAEQIHSCCNAQPSSSDSPRATDSTRSASAGAPQPDATDSEADDIRDAAASAGALDKAGDRPVLGYRFRAGGCDVDAATGHRLCCDPRISAMIEDARSNTVGVGRQSRLINRSLRRALERRDQHRCQFPGCGTTRNLHAHHAFHWAKGGPTELSNLILVCNFHHHQLHEGGWHVEPGTFVFISPEGIRVDPTPTRHLLGDADKTTHSLFATYAPLAEAENIPFDLGLAIESLTYNRRHRHERNAPAGEETTNQPSTTNQSSTTSNADKRPEHGPLPPIELERYIRMQRSNHTSKAAQTAPAEAPRN